MSAIKINTVTNGQPPCPPPAPKPEPPKMRPPTDPPRPFPPPPPFFPLGPCCPSTLQVVDNIKVVSLTPDTITVQEGVVDGQKAFGISCNVSSIPEPPTTDGVYTLKCTVVNGVATYSWETTEGD